MSHSVINRCTYNASVKFRIIQEQPLKNIVFVQLLNLQNLQILHEQALYRVVHTSLAYHIHIMDIYLQWNVWKPHLMRRVVGLSE